MTREEEWKMICIRGVQRMLDEVYGPVIYGNDPMSGLRSRDDKELLIARDLRDVAMLLDPSGPPALVAGIGDMIVNGRLTEDMVPDDWEWLNKEIRK